MLAESSVNTFLKNSHVVNRGDISVNHWTSLHDSHAEMRAMNFTFLGSRRVRWPSGEQHYHYYATADAEIYVELASCAIASDCMKVKTEKACSIKLITCLDNRVSIHTCNAESSPSRTTNILSSTIRLSFPNSCFHDLLNHHQRAVHRFSGICQTKPNKYPPKWIADISIKYMTLQQSDLNVMPTCSLFNPYPICPCPAMMGHSRELTTQRRTIRLINACQNRAAKFLRVMKSIMMPDRKRTSEYGSGMGIHRTACQ